jgi:hypothetical protein
MALLKHPIPFKISFIITIRKINIKAKAVQHLPEAAEKP